MSVVLFVLTLVGWAYLYRRLRRAEDRQSQEQYDRVRDSETIAQLTRRIWALEKSQTAPLLVPSLVPIDAPIETVVATPINAAPFTPLPVVAPEPTPLEPTSPDPMPPHRTWRQQLRESMGGQEWEAVVGGNWLNKLGVLVLVIGIALLLGYEFTHVGPGGRVATGIVLSLAMLVGGMFVERKPAYAIFARGLIGGGWAALYFTSYAMHAVPAAKVIENPYLASALLLAVASGMITHSLRYRSQTVSGLAYFIAFATLALSESTPFSVLALLPLAASLLYLANRFGWHQMAVFGLFATYATCASRPDAGAPLAASQALFAIYWALFEAFDLFRLRRSTASWTIGSFILPINAIGFLSLSTVQWQRSSPDYLYAFLAGAAVLYLASALLRARLRPSSTFDESSSTLERMAGGSYEGPLTISALLGAGAILLRASGEWINLGLLIEGEMLFLAGLRFNQKYLRQLARAAFLAAVIKLLLVDQVEPGSIAFAGRSWLSWSPVAALSALLFYVNRMLRVSEGLLYGAAASGLIALVLAQETPYQYLCVAWLAFGTLLFEAGFRLRQSDLRYHSYILGVLGTGAGLLVNSLGVGSIAARSGWQLPWLPLAISAVFQFVAALRISLSDDRIAATERKASWLTASSSAALLFAIVWKVAPLGYLGAGWLVVGAVLFELGLRGLPKHFRWLSYFVSAAGFWNMFWNHVVRAHIGSDISEPVSLAIAIVVCVFVAARIFRPMPDSLDDREREWCRDLFAGAGALFAMTLLWLKLPPPIVSPLWAALGVAVFEIGVRLLAARIRLLAHLVLATVCLRLFLFDLAYVGDSLHITYRALTVLPILVSQYYIWWSYQRANISAWERVFSRVYLYAPAILFITLARVELGPTLGLVGWSVFAVALYQAGQLYKLADLRWQSYAVALLAFSFTTRMLAGNQPRDVFAYAVVASFYCAQLLAPRDSKEHVERYARAFYSLLATLLLAILLFYDVSGSTLTMAWSAEALALLGAGFPLRDRVQRLSGLTLFLICVLKLFLYDLRQLDTINRILSFIVLGLILVGVSWVYTRFRDRIQRYL